MRNAMQNSLTSAIPIFYSVSGVSVTPQSLPTGCTVCLAWPMNDDGIIPSDDPGQALSVNSKDIHLYKHAKISGIHRTL